MMTDKVNLQRYFVLKRKREIYLNARILNKLRPMSPELAGLLFKENIVFRITQNMFNHLIYYLVSIIDKEAANKFTWPLCDSKTERIFRRQLSEFIANNKSKGLSLIMSSYFRTPESNKIILLMFQMSQLAVQHVLVSKMAREGKIDLYKDMTVKYQSKSEGFIDEVLTEVEAIQTKFRQHRRRRLELIEIAALFRKRLVSMEEKLRIAQKFLDNLTDKYIKHNSMYDEAIKNELTNILNINEPAAFFDNWFEYVDFSVKDMNSKWDAKVTPFLDICNACQKNSAYLLQRFMGAVDYNSYMVQYNHVTDQICTNDLENRVYSKHKDILKNIVRNKSLYFPNLIRGFLISICYILQNKEIGDGIYKFNENLEDGLRNMNEFVLTMRVLNIRVMNAESKIQPSDLSFDQLMSVTELETPPIPDLSGLKSSWESAVQEPVETFIPLSISKCQFNLHRRHNSFNFSQKQPKILFTPLHQCTQESFETVSNSLLSCCVTAYDHPNISTNFNNISPILQLNSRGNKTEAECLEEFAKQRLLSNKKFSSLNKFKQTIVSPESYVLKCALLDESLKKGEDISRSFTSYKEKNCNFLKTFTRNLSFMQESAHSLCFSLLLDVSGIAALEKDDTFFTS